MKDLGHHMNKLNKKVEKEAKKDPAKQEDWQKYYHKEPSDYEKKKLGKISRRHDEMHAQPTADEKNKKKKKRTSRLRKRSHDSNK